MVSEQDAHDFCIATSQIVPVLLLSLFLIDRDVPGFTSAKKIRKLEVGSRREQDEVLSKISRVQSELEDEGGKVREAKERLAALQASEMSPEAREAWDREWEELRGREERLKESQAKVLDAVSSLPEIGDLYARWVQRRNIFQLNYLMTYVSIALSGMAGEWLALEGVLRLVDYRLAVAVSVSCVMTILTALGNYMLARLRIKEFASGKSGVVLDVVSRLSMPLIATISLGQIISGIYGGHVGWRI